MSVVEDTVDHFACPSDLGTSAVNCFLSLDVINSPEFRLSRLVKWVTAYSLNCPPHDILMSYIAPTFRLCPLACAIYLISHGHIPHCNDIIPVTVIVMEPPPAFPASSMTQQEWLPESVDMTPLRTID